MRRRRVRRSRQRHSRPQVDVVSGRPGGPKASAGTPGRPKARLVQAKQWRTSGHLQSRDHPNKRRQTPAPLPSVLPISPRVRTSDLRSQPRCRSCGRERHEDQRSRNPRRSGGSEHLALARSEGGSSPWPGRVLPAFSPFRPGFTAQDGGTRRGDGERRPSDRRAYTSRPRRRPVEEQGDQ